MNDKDFQELLNEIDSMSIDEYNEFHEKALKMKQERKVFNKRCDKKCIVHRLVTHNTCLFCKALRNSPYVDEKVKNKSDVEIMELQKKLEEEMD